MIKVGIVGPESTGKSELSRKLALHFNSTWVKEYAREYLENLNRDYEYSDLKIIAKGQVKSEETQSKKNPDCLFCDTTLMVIKVWSDFKYHKTDEWILKKYAEIQYDFYLLCDIDVPWQPDPLREHPNSRLELMNIYKDELKKTNTPYAIVSGIDSNRLKNAIKEVNRFKLSIQAKSQP